MNEQDCNDRDDLIASYLSYDPSVTSQLVEKALNAVLEGEMPDLLGVEKGEWSTARRGYRSGHYTRRLRMKVGTVELRVPQDRDGRFNTQVFEGYHRSEKALMSTLAEMYVQGVSTRKVTKLAESLRGAFSAQRGDTYDPSDRSRLRRRTEAAAELPRHEGGASRTASLDRALGRRTRLKRAGDMGRRKHRERLHDMLFQPAIQRRRHDLVANHAAPFFRPPCWSSRSWN